MEPEQQRPYHIQAIYDLQADNSTTRFRTEIDECRKVIAQLVADNNSSEQQIARVNILRYLYLQLSRAKLLRTSLSLSNRGRRFYADNNPENNLARPHQKFPSRYSHLSSLSSAKQPSACGKISP